MQPPCKKNKHQKATWQRLQKQCIQMYCIQWVSIPKLATSKNPWWQQVSGFLPCRLLLQHSLRPPACHGGTASLDAGHVRAGGPTNVSPRRWSLTAALCGGYARRAVLWSGLGVGCSDWKGRNIMQKQWSSYALTLVLFKRRTKLVKLCEENLLLSHKGLPLV